jgi:hypothetical protein
MDYEILAVHINYNNGDAQDVRVAWVSNEEMGLWRVSKNNTKPKSSYPVHDISKVNHETVQQVAGTGLEVSKAEACRYFPDLSPGKFESA